MKDAGVKGDEIKTMLDMQKNLKETNTGPVDSNDKQKQYFRPVKTRSFATVAATNVVGSWADLVSVTCKKC